MSVEEAKIKFLEVKLNYAVKRADDAERLAMNTAASLNSVVSRYDDATEKISLLRERAKEAEEELKKREENDQVSPSAKAVHAIVRKHDVPDDKSITEWVDDLVHEATSQGQLRAYNERKVETLTAEVHKLNATLARYGRERQDFVNLLPKLQSLLGTAELLLPTKKLFARNPKRNQQKAAALKAEAWVESYEPLRLQIKALLERLFKAGE